MEERAVKTTNQFRVGIGEWSGEGEVGHTQTKKAHLPVNLGFRKTHCNYVVARIPESQHVQSFPGSVINAAHSDRSLQ